MAEDQYGIDWSEIGDLMRPYTPEEDDTPAEQAQPEPEPERAPEPAPAAESRDAGENEQDDGSDKQPKKKGFTKKRGKTPRREAFRMPRWMELLLQYMPFVIMLLLAPRVDDIIIFVGGARLPYWLVLALTAAPLLLLCLKRPMEDDPVLRLAALCLPMEVYFMCVGARENPSLLMLMAVAVVAVLTGYRMYGNRPARRSPFYNEDGGPEEGEKHKITQKDFLRFGVCCAAVVFLPLAIYGVVRASSQPAAPPVAAQPQSQPVGEDGQPLPFSFERAMERIADLTPGRWGHLTRAEKDSAMQALLDAETDYQGLSRFELRDKEIIGRKYKELPSVRSALLSGKNKMDSRIKAVCFAVYLNKMLSIGADNADMVTYDAAVRDYVDTRCAHYSALIAQYWGDISAQDPELMEVE